MELIRTLRWTLRLLFPRVPVARILVSSLARVLEQLVVAAPADVVARVATQCGLPFDATTCLLVPAAAWGPGPRWLRARCRGGRACIVPALGVPGLRVCLAGETALFNLATRLVGVAAAAGNTRLHVRLATEDAWRPRVADAITVALASPGAAALDREALEAALAQFFSAPRLAAVGDLLFIDVCGLVPRLRYTQRDAGEVYVRVTELTPAEPGFILKGTTAISQGAGGGGWLPPSVSMATADGAVLPRCPPGLEACLEDLRLGVGTLLSGGETALPSVTPAFLIRGARGSGKTLLADALAKSLGVGTVEGEGAWLRGGSARALEQRWKALADRCRPPALLRLRRLEALACADPAAPDGAEQQRRLALVRAGIAALPPGVVLLALTGADDQQQGALAPALARCFLRSTSLPALDAAARARCLRWLIQRAGGTSAGVDLEAVAAAAAGFVLADLQALVTHAARLAYLRARGQGGNAQPTQADFDNALALLAGRMATAAGAPRIATVTWADVGGHAALKTEIQRLLEPPAALAGAGLRRAGLLLYGPPGGGKTLLAAAAAAAGRRCFLSVKGPELLSAYVGQSEAGVRDVFARARAAAPCLVFLDELDALAPTRGRAGDSAGVMDRVVSQLLSEMDGLQSRADVIVMAATNRPDLIDPALMRPGRLDKLLFVGPCGTRADRLAVLSALTRRMRLAPGVLLQDVVASLGGASADEGGASPTALTGADLMALAAAAWNNAARRAVRRLQAGGDPELEADGVEVEAADFSAAAEALGPSVSAEDLAYFQQLHRKLGSAR